MNFSVDDGFRHFKRSIFSWNSLILKIEGVFSSLITTTTVNIVTNFYTLFFTAERVSRPTLLLMVCEYVGVRPLQSIAMILPPGSSLMVNCSIGAPSCICFSFCGMRRATHMRHGPISLQSSPPLPPSPSPLSVWHGSSVDDICNMTRPLFVHVLV